MEAVVRDVVKMDFMTPHLAFEFHFKIFCEMFLNFYETFIAFHEKIHKFLGILREFERNLQKF